MGLSWPWVTRRRMDARVEVERVVHRTSLERIQVEFERRLEREVAEERRLGVDARTEALLQAAAAESRAEARREVVEAMTQEVGYLREQLAIRDRLLAEMRREGFEPPVQHYGAADDPDQAGKLDPGVVAAIEAVARPGTALYADLVRIAETQLAADRAPKELAAEFLAGSTLNPHHL